MERNNLDIYADSIKLTKSNAEVKIIKKCSEENKIIITHPNLRILLNYFNYVLDNYTSDKVSEIKLKSKNKIVLYAKA